MFHTKPLSIIVVCVLLLCYCTSIIICSSLQTVVIGSGISSSHQTTSLSRHVQESAATTYSNDGGNTQNNGTNDNGMWQYYGSQQVGVNSRSEKTYPYSLYFEKSVIVFTNWARMSPVGFIARFNSSITAGISLASSGLAPLFEHFNLEESSRYHSYDMAINNCFQHPSCITNEDTFVRIKTFYSVSASMAENIAAGQTTPLSVTIAWINSSGHRANIINSAYTIIGAGYFPGYSNSSYGHYWTQNFASGSHGISNPIVAGTHFQITTGQLTFLANYYHTYDLKNSRKLQAFTLYLEDQPYTMTLPSTNQYSDSSVSLMGTYEYTLAANTTTSAGCRKYYFKAVDASGTAFYYPSYGYLLTQGENKGCTTSYSNQQRSSQNAVASNVNKATSFSPLLFITLHIFLLISYLLISYP